MAGLDDSITASVDEIYDARAEVIHAVAVEGGRRVDNSEKTDVGVDDVATITMEMMGVNLQTLPPGFQQDIEPVVAVEGIFSVDKSFTRGVFAWTRKMVQKRLVSLLAGNHSKAVGSIVLASIGVALSLLVATTDGNKKSNDRVEQTYCVNQEDPRIVMLTADEEK